MWSMPVRASPLSLKAQPFGQPMGISSLVARPLVGVSDSAHLQWCLDINNPCYKKLLDISNGGPAPTEFAWENKKLPASPEGFAYIETPL